MATVPDELKERLLKKLDELSDRHREVERQMSEPETASDRARLGALAREHGRLSRFVAIRDEMARADRQRREAQESLADSGGDVEFEQFARQEIEQAEHARQELFEQFVELLVTDEEGGDRNVIMEVRAGTGGEEAALFAVDLFGMYTRYAESHGWKVEPLDSSPTDLGGMREVTFQVNGPGAWSKLRYESGGHRVQRVPKTESQGRIHTSLATVAVLPEAKEVDVHIDPNDVEMSFMRSSGPGGQHVNKTSSCVRLVHKPTGITVRCQDQKSQGANRRKAVDLLRAKLYHLHKQEAVRERDAMRRGQIGSGDRNERIRTYNFPQDRVTDHRIGLDLFGIESFLMGDCDRMFDALAEHDKQRRMEAFTEPDSGPDDKG